MTVHNQEPARSTPIGLQILRGLWMLLPVIWLAAWIVYKNQPESHRWDWVDRFTPLAVLLYYVVPSFASPFRRRKWAGSLLLSLGRATVGRIFLILGVVLVLLGILLGIHELMTAHPASHYATDRFYSDLGTLSFGIFIILLADGTSRREIREKGIWTGSGLWRWDQIASYQWAGERGNILRISQKSGPLRLPFETWGWRIRPDRKDAVDRIFAEHLSGGRGGDAERRD
jgi:hypothetical protein